MQPAFLFFFLFPPPAAGALGLARRDRARAGRAADREEAAIVQPIVGNIVLADEIKDAFARPVQQRIDLEQSDTPDRARHTPYRARSADCSARSPVIQADGFRERAPQRLDFAHRAAALARFDRGAEPIDAVPRDPGLDASVFGR